MITCDTPHVPPASYVVGYDYNVHSTITYHCDPGHILRGEPLLKCLITGEWDNEAPDCKCKFKLDLDWTLLIISIILVVDCKPLTPVPFGTIKYTKNTTFLGSEVIYNCANTHRLNGVAQRTCLDSAQWSEAAPKCEEIRCTEPVLANHSILSVTGNDRMYGRTLIRSHQDSSSSIQTYKVGALAKYRCERGYKIVGDPLITCEESGTWGGKLPECVCKFSSLHALTTLKLNLFRRRL